MELSSTKKVFLFFALFSFLFISFANADEKTDQVDKVFDKWDSTASPGVALAVIKDGEIIYEQGYGMADLEHNIPINPKTVFRMGSTSKQFTAACIAILSLQGKISLDDNIRKYIPEMPQYERTITVRNLVHHTSGLRDYCGLLSLAGYVSYLDHPTIEETNEIISKQKNLNFLPGEKYSYSNSNYFLMGIIVNRVTGQTLNEFAQENIFKPLGMKNTHFHGDLTVIVKNRADGYSPEENGFRINMSTFDHVGDGGLYTTVEDMYLWDQSFYNHKLGKDFVELVQTPGELNSGEKLDYAFGLRISEYKGLKTVGHGGSWVGYRTSYIRFPEQNFSVVCLANLSHINPSSLCQKVADIYLSNQFTKKPVTKPEKKEIEPIELPIEKLKNKVGNYYSQEERMWMSLTLEEGKLKAQTLWDTLYLVPVSETKFFAVDAPVDICVEFFDNKVELDIWGREKITFEKGKEIPKLTETKLKNYVGDYYSEELMTTYKALIK
ncbi:MAG TPA: serine hydrolase domain-containing protein, partial [Acidobacteriota bacterium]|nr:serine hydrolase domain-containing protein [Acidobacteriota bacterium]